MDQQINPETGLTEQEERIAKRAAELAADLAVEKMTTQAYAAIGKGFVTRMLWLIGLVVCGFTLYAAKKGWLDPLI